MSSTRQLAAILFTDIVGYSQMMHADEKKAVALLKHYNTTLEKWVSQHGGRVANYYGDGNLCIFNSATAAVQCSVDMQKELRQEPTVPLRIGLHIGEVIFEEDKAIGDGVNIASRIQSLGQENTILISADIHDKIKNNSSFTTKSLGHFDFKNISKPMEVFALNNDGLVVPERKKLAGKVVEKNYSRRNIYMAAGMLLLLGAAIMRFYSNNQSDASTPIEKSIAVLPFTDMSQAGDQEYFSDGLTEDIITQLAKIKAFKVTSRTSIMKYKGLKKSLKEIGSELGASIILEGSVQKSGDKVRITAQLINALTDEHLWAETYDRTLDDIFAIQTDIATNIASALKASLTTKEEQDLSKKYTLNTGAYQLYLQGRFEWNKRLEAHVRKSISFFKLAIEQDSTYGLAYAGLGDAYLMLGVYSALRPDESFPIGKMFAEKALQLDPSLAEAYATLIDIYIHYDWDASAAEGYFQKAVEFNPEYANAYHWHSEVYAMLHEFEKAIEESRKALEHDPYNVSINMQLGKNYIYAGQYKLALEQLQKTLAFDSSSSIVHYNLALAYLALKELDKALVHAEKAIEFGQGNTRMMVASGYVKAVSGNKDEAESMYNDLLQQSKTRYVPAYDLATLSVGLGNEEQAMLHLTQAFNNKEPWMPFLDMNPLFIPMKANPTFDQLVEKIESGEK
ncbi:MAG TPA: adenylate/guanylate cyclase domain-containing protein [Saprospiraceae bacterium]